MKAFTTAIDKLRNFYGRPEPPNVTDPLGLILLENVAYLVSDERREQAFNALCERVGLSPPEILTAHEERLMEVARLGGMHPAARVEKLRRIAQIALQEFDGDLDKVVKQPIAQAKKSLKKFPGIGDPGAEKILLFSKTQPVLALDSNGLRVLLRLGYGEERKSYAATYRSAQETIASELRRDFDWLIASHQLLRRHGQELCKTAEPLCASCPLKSSCRYYLQNVRRRH
ncbi:MAG TPA: endonuclease III domain-containing protein [Blastocatellia bacterium]